ncbi:MAG: hypothetical protein ACREBU_05015 [Nitrososphaera sp.]
MVSRPSPYLFILLNAILKAAGADRWDGSDWNKLTKHFAQPVLLTSADSPVALQITDSLLKCDTSGGSITLQLPPVATSGGKFYFAIKTSAANTLTADPDGSELVNNAATISVTDLHSWMLLWCDSTAWWALLPAAPAAGTDEKVEVQETGTIVGAQARKINWSNANDLDITEDAGGNRINHAIKRNSANGIAGLDASGDLAKTEQHPSTVYNDQANTYTAGAKQTVSHSATTAGLRIGIVAGDPSSTVDGDVWYNDTTKKFRCQENGSVKDLDTAGSGGGGGGTWTIQSRNSGSATPYTAAWGAAVLWSTGSGDKEVDLTTAVGHAGEKVLIKKTDNGVGIITIDPSGTQKIDEGVAGAPIIVIAFKESIVLCSDGPNVFVESWS